MKLISVGAALLSAASIAAAPPLAAQDTLRLPELQQAAQQRDPRSRQMELLAAQSSLRNDNLKTERLPQFTFSGEAAHQSDVTTFTLGVPGAQPPVPPRDHWQALLNVQQLLYDGGSVALRRSVERARLAEAHEAVRVAQYRLRAEVNGYFFSAFLLQERNSELAALTGDLESRLAVVRDRLREGAALPGDTAALRAELLRIAQSQMEVVASRGAAMGALARLAGDAVDSGDVLVLPDFAVEVQAVRAAGALGTRARPEFSQFELSRDRLVREETLADIERRPRVYLFGQGGFGRPGFNQFSGKIAEIWQGGVRFEWRFWNWGNSARQRDILELQRQIIRSEEAAFAETLERSVQADLADMDRLEAALLTDERIIALREQVERQARAQLDEGEITVSDYVSIRTDVLEARLAGQRHRAELAQARARYLTTLGADSR